MSQKTRYVLALDSSMTGCAACVLDLEIGQAYTRSSEAPRGQAELLVPYAQDCVAEAGIAFSDIDLIATTVGPGSFTGLRVSMSAAKSFALALDIPLIGLTTMDVIHRQCIQKAACPDDADICILLETKRSDYYMQIFKSDGAPDMDAKALDLDGVRDHVQGRDFVFAGDVLERFVEESGMDIARRLDVMQVDPQVLAELGAERFSTDGAPERIDPLYLRGADVSQPKNKPRQLKA